MIYLIRYDREKGALIGEIEQFDDDDAVGASEARLEAEVAAGAQNRNIEIVTLRAGALDDLRVTHSRYFRNVSELKERLRLR